MKYDGIETRECFNIIFLLDTSISMSGERIGQLNNAMQDVLNELHTLSIEMSTDAFVRVIQFNSSASWIIGDAKNGVLALEAANSWKSLSASGSTDTAAAIEKSLEALHISYLGRKNRKPVVVLVTDGYSNDASATRNATEKLKKALSGDSGKEKVYRVGVGVIGYNEAELVDFASKGKIIEDNEIKAGAPLVFKVDDVSDLSNVIRDVAVSSLRSVIADNGADENSTLVINRTTEESW